MTDLEAFEAWWASQETGLGSAHKFTAWNAWIARAVVEADRAQRVPDGWKLVRSPITEEMHVAAAKVLIRAAGLDEAPQRMLDALLESSPAPEPKP